MIGRRRRWPAPRASARCWCSPTAPTPATPRSPTSPPRSSADGVAARRRRARQRSGDAAPGPLCRRSPDAGPARSSPPTRRRCARRSPPRPTCWPARCSSPRRARPASPQDRGDGHGQPPLRRGDPSPPGVLHRAVLADRAGRRVARAHRRGCGPAADLGAVRRRRRPLGVGLLAARWSCWSRPGPLPLGGWSTASRRYTVAGSHRAASAEPRTDVTFAPAKETAANVLRRNQDLDARISAPAAGRRQRAQVRRVAPASTRRSSSSPAWSACCSAAATSSSASSSWPLGLVGPWMYLGFRRRPPPQGVQRRRSPTPCS